MMDIYGGTTSAITGGSSGLGLTTARLLTEGGGRVVITGRTQASLDRAAKELGPNAVALRSDAASLSDIHALAEFVKAEFGVLDLLFVNAGITHFGSVEDMTEAVYDDLFSINVKGLYFTVQQLVPLMRPGSGIVLTTSVANVKGLAMISVYAATKAAVRSMTRSFARELLPRDIRVNAVSPGPIDTGIIERSLPDQAARATRHQMTTDNPMERFGDPLEVAKAVIFLAFDATYTTGAELTVDGGGSQL